MERVLSAEQNQLLRRERSLLNDLRTLLARMGATDEDLTLLRESIEQLDELFLLVVVGEFNAGKSAFLNAMLGERLLKEGVTPTTSRINLLRYGEDVDYERVGEDLIAVTLPVEWLREINLVDTPGTNAVVAGHQQITEHFVPRSDLVLFVTSADRPFSESERTFLERIREWGKKIVIVVNKIDLITDVDDRAQVLDFVRENARNLLGVEPEIFPISARMALSAKESANGTPPAGDEWQASQFGALEQYILESLDVAERMRLQLTNPLGVASYLIEQYRQVVDERRSVLRGDFETLDTIESHLNAYREDMRRDFRYHLSHVDNVLYEMAERGDAFFDDSLRLTRIFELVNSEKLRGEFERRVVGDTSRQIERQVNDLIDWLVDRDYRQWQDVMQFLNQRQMEHSEQMVGRAGGEFALNRERLLNSVGREANHVIESYDREAESLKLAQDVQRTIVQTAALEVGALGLGTLLVALLQTTVFDITGILGASAVAAMGLYILPYRRNKLKAELRASIGELREKLVTAMTKQFESELAHSVQRIREAIEPYTRFVRVERERLDTFETELRELRAERTQIADVVASL